MMELLLAIQATLRQIAGIRREDVFLSPDKDWLPPWAQFPAIGIKDGRVDRHDLSGGVTELHLPVELYIFEKFGKSDRAILSIFETAKSIHGLLQDNELDGHIKEPDPGHESPIQIRYRKDGIILRKTLFYEYEREEE